MDALGVHPPHLQQLGDPLGVALGVAEDQLDQMKSRKNLGLFSATISREVMDIAWVYQRDAVEITVRADEENKPDILQYRLELSMDQKVDAVEKILSLAYRGNR